MVISTFETQPLRRYRAICHALTQAYPTPPTGHFARHVQTLAALISGIVGGKSTPLPHIATKVPDGSKPESRVKRFARWLDNAHILEEMYFSHSPGFSGRRIASEGEGRSRLDFPLIPDVRRRRLVRVRHRVVFGTLAAIEHVLAAHGWQINTAFIERLHLTIRQRVAAVGRRVATLCKGEEGLRQLLAVYHCYDNFCLPHASVRQPLPQPEPTNGTGSTKPWRPCTPAMAAGLTDHVWSLREIRLFRVPPWPQPAGV
jgi:hypothetical protein